MLITSLDNNKIKKYLKLKNKKYRDIEKLFIIEGEHLVEEAIKCNKLYDLLVLEGFNYDTNFPYTNVSLNVMKKISDMESAPKVIGIVKILENNEITGDKVILLDGIRDPGNLGTIIRSSVAFNVSDIVLSNDTVDLYNSKVIRSSQGMLFKVNVIRSDLQKIISELKEKDYEILGTSVVNGIDVGIIKPNKYALVMGNEGQGVSSEILDMCDKCIYIKMNEKCESLNVGVAASIIIYELNK